MGPPLTVVLVNAKTNGNFTDENRRLIARISPLCYAYNFHLLLVNFKIEKSPVDFARDISTTTSISNSGKRLIKLAQNGKLRFTNLPLTENVGKIIICTHKPDETKIINSKEIKILAEKEKLALVFGCKTDSNKNVRKLVEKSEWHIDVSGKNIELTLDSEIGAVSTIIKH